MSNTPKCTSRAAGRRNIAVACESCRARKVRCDGCRPVCRACTRRNNICEYTVSLGPWDRTRQKYVEELERKVRLRQTTAPAPPGVAVFSHGAPSGPPPVESEQAALSGLPAPRRPAVEQDFQGNACLEGVSASGGPSQLSGSVHLGQSSTGVFLRHLHHSVVPSSSQSPRALTLADLGTHTPICEATSLHYILPPRDEAEKLLACYWEIHHPIYPAVSRGEFLRDLETIYDSTAPKGPHRMTYCLANLMFALAERSMPRSIEHDGCHDYFARAKQLLHFDMFGNFSFPLLQALVLSAQYLQSTEKPRQCWAMVGFGISAAQSVGLHLAEAVGNMQPESDRRLVIYVWRCLVSLDRTLSMTLGRSPRVSLSVARAFTNASHSNMQDTPDSMTSHAFFDQSSRLFDVLHEILELLYSEGPEIAPVIEIIGQSSRLEKKLNQWVQALPPQLCLNAGQGANGHARFLRQRYLQVRIILMRPGLVHFIRHTAESSWDLEQATTWYCANQSVEAAAEMADISTTQNDQPGPFLHATPWWYQLQYCYNAGVTLLAARLSEKLTEGSRMQHIDAGISNCVRAIEACSLASPTASRCLSMFLSAAGRLSRQSPSPDEIGAQAGRSADGRESAPWDEAWASLWVDNSMYPMPDQPWEDLLSFI